MCVSARSTHVLCVMGAVTQGVQKKYMGCGFRKAKGKLWQSLQKYFEHKIIESTSNLPV